MILAVLLPGCWLDFGGFAVCGTPEGNPCPTDGEVVEAGAHDAGPDGGTDGGTGPTDGGPHDAATGPDGGPDGGTDGGPGPACADGSDGESWSDTMKGCSGSVTQLESEGLCGEGWHVCTHEEYFARGGADLAPSMRLWLSACLDDTGCPREGFCTEAVTEQVYSKHSCSGDPIAGGTVEYAVGLAAEPVKGVVGCGACAYWSMSSTTNLGGAVCCR